MHKMGGSFRQAQQASLGTEFRRRLPRISAVREDAARAIIFMSPMYHENECTTRREQRVYRR